MTHLSLSLSLSLSPQQLWEKLRYMTLLAQEEFNILSKKFHPTQTSLELVILILVLSLNLIFCFVYFFFYSERGYLPTTYMCLNHSFLFNNCNVLPLPLHGLMYGNYSFSRHCGFMGKEIKVIWKWLIEKSLAIWR